MKHTDEEILKALECFNLDMCLGEDCPYWGEPCGLLIQKDIYDFVYRLKAEVERLTLSERDAYKQLEKGNARMNAIIEAEKTEAIKEFTEELKKHKIKPEFPWDDYYIYESVIDDVAQKMIGRADNEQ